MKHLFLQYFLSLLAFVSLGTLAISISLVSATQIGTGVVVGSGALNAPIIWNNTFSSGSASGTINGIVVTGRVLPTLNMTISGSGVINLGNLSSTSASTGSVNIEIGTNAINGASVTARSTNAGMTNISSGAIVLNNLTTDGFADSYRFVSSANTTDSTAPGFTHTATLNTEVNNNTTNHLVYSCTRPQPLTGVDDMVFSVVVQPNGQTPAGDYRDVIVITVTGNF